MRPGGCAGGIVDTREEQWYAVLFQDYGAVGRIPVLVPVRWVKNYPVFGDCGRIPENIETQSTRPGYVYQPLAGSDDFICRPDQNGEYHLNSRWQFNHEPDWNCCKVDGILGSYTLTASKICNSLLAGEEYDYPKDEISCVCGGSNGGRGWAVRGRLRRDMCTSGELWHDSRYKEAGEAVVF